MVKSKKYITVDIDCEQRDIKGELSFPFDDFDEIEVSEIAEMLFRVIESWCNKRDFVHANLSEYKCITVN